MATKKGRKGRTRETNSNAMPQSKENGDSKGYIDKKPTKKKP